MLLISKFWLALRLLSLDPILVQDQRGRRNPAKQLWEASGRATRERLEGESFSKDTAAEDVEALIREATFGRQEVHSVHLIRIS